MKGSTGVLLGVLVLGAVGLGVAWVLLERPDEAIAPRVDDRTEGRPEGELAEQPAGEARVAAGGAPAGIEPPADAPGPLDRSDATIRVRGRVLDVAGTPIPGVSVGIEGRSTPLDASDALGVFEFDLEPGRRKIVSTSDEWITVRYDLVQPGEPERERFVIVAPPLALEGRVVDATDQPIAGATVRVDVPIAAFAGFPLALDSTGVVSASAKSGPDGSFRLVRAPSIPRAALETSAEGFEDDRRPLPSESASDLRIELRRPEATDAALEGVVFHPDGSPAAEATVHLDDRNAATDERGAFRLPLGRVDEGTYLVATKKGFQPAVMPEYGRVLAASDGHPAPVQLVLGPPPLSISGRVLEADGKPCRGWSVAIRFGTPISQFRVPPITAEGVTSGQDRPRTTDASGAFVIEGLRGTSYVLQAWGRDGRMIVSDPIDAGASDVELRCEADAFLREVRGRVVSRDGLPLPKVDVSVSLVTFEMPFGRSWEDVAATKTGEGGFFALEKVPRRATRLDIDGEGVQPTSLAVEEIDLERPLVIVVGRTCRFRYESRPGEVVPTELEVLDAEGAALDLVTREARSMMSGSRARLADGQSHVLSVGEEAVRLVLYKEGEVLSSQPLKLAAGEIVTVHRAP